MPSVKSLHIYPVKSLGGVSLNRAHVDFTGFQHDRRWMLIDEHGVFQTQRQLTAMAQFSCTPLSAGFAVQFGDSSLEIPWETKKGKLLKTKVWSDFVQALNPSDEMDSWFSERLQKKCRLVYMPASSKRPVDVNYAAGITSLSDGFPYLVTNQNSLTDLNARLNTPIPMDRFRPNVVVQQLPAFSEDAIQHLKCGAVTFDLVKRCARCVVITTNQETGVRDKEPMVALASYRTFEGKVLFGVNAMALGTGTVHVGDTVAVSK